MSEIDARDRVDLAALSERDALAMARIGSRASITIHSLTTAKRRKVLVAPQADVQRYESISFSARGDLLAALAVTSEAERRLCVWQWEDARLVFTQDLALTQCKTSIEVYRDPGGASPPPHLSPAPLAACAFGPASEDSELTLLALFGSALPLQLLALTQGGARLAPARGWQAVARRRDAPLCAALVWLHAACAREALVARCAEDGTLLFVGVEGGIQHLGMPKDDVEGLFEASAVALAPTAEGVLLASKDGGLLRGVVRWECGQAGVTWLPREMNEEWTTHVGVPISGKLASRSFQELPAAFAVPGSASAKAAAPVKPGNSVPASPGSAPIGLKTGRETDARERDGHAFSSARPGVQACAWHFGAAADSVALLLSSGTVLRAVLTASEGRSDAGPAPADASADRPERALSVRCALPCAHPGGVAGLSACVRRPLLASVGRVDRTLKLWYWDTFCLHQSHTFDEQTVGVSLHPGGYQLIVVLSSRLCVHAVAARELSLLRDIPLRGCSCASFSPSGALFAAQTGSAVVLFDSLSCASLAVLRGPAARLSCLHWSFDGGALASGGSDGALSAWSALSGQRIRDHSAKSQALAALAHVAPTQEEGRASAAGEALVSAGIAGLVRGFVPGTSGGLIPVATLDLRTPAHSLLSNPFAPNVVWAACGDGTLRALRCTLSPDASQSSLQGLASALVDSLGLSCAALSADGQTAFAAGTHGRISVVGLPALFPDRHGAAEGTSGGSALAPTPKPVSGPGHAAQRAQRSVASAQVAPDARLLPWTRLVLVPEAELEERCQREEQLAQALAGGARELAYQLGVRDAAHDAQTQVMKAVSVQQCQAAAARCKELEEQLRALQSSSEEKLIAVRAECQSRLVLMLSSSHDRAEADRVQRERLEADMNAQRQSFESHVRRMQHDTEIKINRTEQEASAVIEKLQSAAALDLTNARAQIAAQQNAMRAAERRQAAQHSSTEQRHADVLKSAEEKAYELRGSNGVLQRQCEILEQRAEDVQKARDAAQQTLETLGKRMAYRDEENAILSKELAKAQAAIGDRDVALQHLQHTVAAREIQLETLHAQLQEARLETSSRENEIAGWAQHSQGLSVAAKHSAAQASRRAAEAASARQRGVVAQEERKLLAQRIIILQAQHASLRASIAQAAQESRSKADMASALLKLFHSLEQPGKIEAEERSAIPSLSAVPSLPAAQSLLQNASTCSHGAAQHGKLPGANPTPASEREEIAKFQRHVALLQKNAEAAQAKLRADNMELLKALHGRRK